MAFNFHPLLCSPFARMGVHEKFGLVFFSRRSCVECPGFLFLLTQLMKSLYFSASFIFDSSVKT